MSGAQAALERVRVMATLWAAAEGDGLSIALDRRVGEAVLSTVREDGSTAESRLDRVKRLAGGWTTPGNTLYYPAAGQAVLDAIAGDGATFPVTGDPRAILAEMAERERLVAMGHVRDPKDVPRLLAAVEAVLNRAAAWDADAAELDRDVIQSRKSPYPGDHALGDTDEALARQLRQCAADLRADLLAALTGGETGG